MSGRVSELSTLAIRRYEEPDHDEVWALHNVALEAVGVHGGNGAWDDDLHHIDQVYLEAGGEFLVGVLDGHIVAMGAFKRISREAAEIKRIRVYPAFQRRGFGQAILERAGAPGGGIGLCHSPPGDHGPAGSRPASVQEQRVY